MTTAGKRWRYRADEPAPGPPSRRHLPRSAVRRLLESQQLPAAVQERLTPELRVAAGAVVDGRRIDSLTRAALGDILAELARAERPSIEIVSRILDEDPFRWRLLEELVRTRFLTLDQAAHLAYVGVGGTPPTGHMVVGRWLKRFFEWGLVRPFTASRSLIDGTASPHGGGSERLIYTPEHQGARLVAARLQQRLASIWWADAPYLSMQAVPHRLDIIDFYVAIRYWLAKCGGQLDTWEIERRYQFGSVTLAPDAYTELWIDDQRYRIFVEVDRGTEGPAQFSARMTAYNSAAGAKEWPERFGEKVAEWPIVLVVLTGVRDRVGGQPQDMAERALALKAAVEKVDGGNWIFPRFKFVPGPSGTYLIPESSPMVRGGNANRVVRLDPVRVAFDRPACWVLRKAPDYLGRVL